MTVWGDETIRLLREANEVLAESNDRSEGMDTPKTDALLKSSTELHHDDWYALVNHAKALERLNGELLEALKIHHDPYTHTGDCWVCLAIAKASE